MGIAVCALFHSFSSWLLLYNRLLLYSFLSVRCPGLSIPSHGSLSSSENTPGSAVKTVCDEGYTVDTETGKSTILCRLNGTWSAALAGCKKG